MRNMRHVKIWTFIFNMIIHNAVMIHVTFINVILTTRKCPRWVIKWAFIIIASSKKRTQRLFKYTIWCNPINFDIYKSKSH